MTALAVPERNVLLATLQGKGALADKLECSEGEAGRKKESFLQALPDLAAWRERVLQKCRETLFVEVCCVWRHIG